MSKRICKNCGSVDIRTAKYSDGDKCYVCEDCCCVGQSDDFPEYTVFHKITQSPEVLAKKLVYRYDGNGTWRSFLLYGYEFLTKEEALAATVAKLKEVAE